MYHVCIAAYEIILYIIAKNIRHPHWNRGAWYFLHNTYLTIELQGIRCISHSRDSCHLTDVNLHFGAPGYRNYFKINSWWLIVTPSIHEPTASYCDVKMIDCSHRSLWTHDVEFGELRDCDNLINLRSRQLFGKWRHNCAYCNRMIHCSLRHTGRRKNIFAFWLSLFVCFTYYLFLYFRTPCFIKGH